jgi:hypothetical protein
VLLPAIGIEYHISSEQQITQQKLRVSTTASAPGEALAEIGRPDRTIDVALYKNQIGLEVWESCVRFPCGHRFVYTCSGVDYLKGNPSQVLAQGTRFDHVQREMVCAYGVVLGLTQVHEAAYSPP